MKPDKEKHMKAQEFLEKHRLWKRSSHLTEYACATGNGTELVQRRVWGLMVVVANENRIGERALRLTHETGPDYLLDWEETLASIARDSLLGGLPFTEFVNEGFGKQPVDLTEQKLLWVQLSCLHQQVETWLGAYEEMRTDFYSLADN